MSRCTNETDEMWNRENRTNLAPDMRRMLIHKSLRRITKKKLRNDEQPDIFLAVKSLLEDMAPVAVRC
jgi:hypothetical protein